ncbi:hypothetical protein DPMN_167102 [Dreissena polymorpha]|uniref:Uncharacterized protein n=1 Tax=Dreissena polymorpha TaxID=45954 RepID=A0A9D4F0S4_DREPO|nr:hypothetical protein DPMN_167102 [Dreissena polymorpha]
MLNSPSSTPDDVSGTPLLYISSPKHQKRIGSSPERQTSDTNIVSSTYVSRLFVQPTTIRIANRSQLMVQRLMNRLHHHNQDSSLSARSSSSSSPSSSPRSSPRSITKVIQPIIHCRMKGQHGTYFLDLMLI